MCPCGFVSITKCIALQRDIDKDSCTYEYNSSKDLWGILVSSSEFPVNLKLVQRNNVFNNNNKKLSAGNKVFIYKAGSIKFIIFNL